MMFAFGFGLGAALMLGAVIVIMLLSPEPRPETLPMTADDVADVFERHGFKPGQVINSALAMQILREEANEH